VLTFGIKKGAHVVWNGDDSGGKLLPGFRKVLGLMVSRRDATKFVDCCNKQTSMVNRDC